MIEWQKIDFEDIIIGSGAGGATCANELSKCGKELAL
jgi:pyruvate/2-oxoglutarate dehydrogenase complex dihydrolipoamide dehydrogenase (E3) component